MKCFVAMLALAAAMANGAQESHPYSFDGYNYYDNQNSLTTDRFSHIPSVKRQFLDLFAEGVPAAFLFTAAGTLGSLAYTEIRSSALRSRIDTIQNSVSTNAATLRTLGTSSTTATTAIAANTAKIATNTNSITSNAGAVKETCTKLNTLIGIGNTALGPQSISAAPADGANAGAAAVGDTPDKGDVEDAINAIQQRLDLLTTAVTDSITCPN